MNLGIDPAIASVIASIIGAIGPIITSLLSVFAFLRERKPHEPKPQSPPPKQRPWLVLCSVFACGIAVTALLVACIRPIPKIGNVDIKIGSTVDDKGNPVSPNSNPDCFLFPDSGSDVPLLSHTFGSRVLSAMIVPDLIPNRGYAWAIKDPKAENRILIHGAIDKGIPLFVVQVIVFYEE